MNEKETLPSENNQTIFEQEITELIHEKVLRKVYMPACQ